MSGDSGLERRTHATLIERAKGSVSPVAGAAGIVPGARVPIILTSRADSARTRVAACPTAILLVHARRRQAAAALTA